MIIEKPDSKPSHIIVWSLNRANMVTVVQKASINRERRQRKPKESGFDSSTWFFDGLDCLPSEFPYEELYNVSRM